MKKEYREMMDRVAVTDEMRSRIFHHIQTMDLGCRTKGTQGLHLKRYLSLAACLTILAAGILALPGILRRPGPAEPPAQVIPDLVQCVSAEELSQTVGFQVVDFAPLPFEPLSSTYLSYWHKLAEIKYTGAESSAVFRMTQGSEDPSGDFNSYDTIEDITVDTKAVTLKGNDGVYTLAVWSDHGFSYSLKLSPGLSQEGWHSMLAEELASFDSADR